MRLRRLLSTLRLRLRAVFRRARVEQELGDEIRDHIDRRIAADVARGVSREQARQAALRAFGGVEQSKEACRDVRGVSAIDHTLQDVRFAARQFARAPMATATMIGIFALGIGFSAALFLFVRSFVNGPVPGIPRQESLVRIRGIDRARPGGAIGREFSYPEYREYAAQQRLFSAVAAWTSSDVVIDVGARQANLQSGAATYVTANYFQVLGLRQTLGAGLPMVADDAGSPQPLVAVISHVLWERHFARSPDVVGQSIRVNGVSVTIAGVAPRRFAGARTGGSQIRVWLPLGARPQVQRTIVPLTSDDDARLGLVARLQPGVRLEETAPIVEAIAARSARQPAATAVTAASTDVVPLIAGNYFPPAGADDEPSAGPVIAVLFPVVILLITCTNVSALLAGRGVARRREIVVRLALGAGRRRVVRQLVTEAVMLAMAAGALGLFVIWLLLRLFDASIPDLAIEIDWRGVAFTFSLALLAGVLFGLSPALHATRLPLQDALKDSASVAIARRLRLQSWLVIAQIAFTQPALLGMGALLLEMRSDLRALAEHPHANRILAVHFNVNPRYGPIDGDREQTLARLEERLAAVPGVEGVVRQENGDDAFDVGIHPSDTLPGLGLASPQQVRAIAAPAGYFPLMGISFVRGRDFDAAERGQERDQRAGFDGGGTVIIGSGLARRLWGDGDAIGRRLVSVGPNLHGAGTFTIVGVVDDAAGGAGGGEGSVMRIFMPRVHTTGHLLIRTHGPAEPLLPTIRAVVADEAPALPVVAARTLAAIAASARRSTVTALSAAGGAGALALVLSAIGLYAVVAFAVGQRVREIGIRTALGAESRQVVRLFVRHGLCLCLSGLTIGLALGIGGARVLTAVEGNGPPAGALGLAALVAVFVIGVALLASWIPARRAARIDPLEALRVE